MSFLSPRSMATLTLGIYLFSFSSHAIPRHPADPVDVVIIGAGFAGLSAARIIHKTQPDLKMTVVEADSKPGGRAVTLMVQGEPVELGGEFVDEEDKAMFSLLKEFGLECEGVTLKGDIFAFTQKEKIPLDQLKSYIHPLLNKLHAIKDSLDERSYFVGINKQYAALEPYLKELSDEEKGLLNALVRDEQGIDVQEAPFSIIEWWIEKLKKYKALIKMKGPLSGIENSELENPNLQYRVRGGVKTLVEALANSIPQDKLLLKKQLTNLSRNENLYSLIFDDSTTLHAKNVILTLPFSVLRSQYGILDDKSLGVSSELRKVIDGMPYGMNTKIIFPTHAPVSLLYAIDIDKGTTFWGNPAGITQMIGGQPGKDLDKNYTLDAARQQNLERIFGIKLAEGTKPIVQNWSQNPFFGGSYSSANKGDFISFLHEQNQESPILCEFATSLLPNIVFAGEHTHFYRSGHMNSAIETGQAAATLLLERMKQ